MRITPRIEPTSTGNWVHWCMLSLNDVIRVDGIYCLLFVAIDRSVEPNRTGKRNQVNSTSNRRVELKAKYSLAVRKD